MKIAVIGLGYVGLANALVLSKKHEVVGFDIDKSKLELLKKRISPLKEEDVQELLNKSSNFKVTDTIDDAICGASLVVVAVPTNFDTSINSFNTKNVSDVVEYTLKHNKSASILIKSTVPSGFTKSLSDSFKSNKIYFSPEFLREGHSIYDSLNPSRIIVGYTSEDKSTLKEAHIIASLLLEACNGVTEVNVISSSEAEAVKLFSNSYLAMRIAFFNELDSYAESKGLNAKNIIDNVSLDPRIGGGYNNPSFGYGGYCLPKDTKELKANFDLVPQTLISSIIESNLVRKEFVASQILSKVKKNEVIGVYLLSMKQGSDNFRESSVIDIIRLLKEKGANLLIYEPSIKEPSFMGVTVENDFDKFILKSNLVIANRIDKKISVHKNIYSRDLYRKD